MPPTPPRLARRSLTSRVSLLALVLVACESGSGSSVVAVPDQAPMVSSPPAATNTGPLPNTPIAGDTSVSSVTVGTADVISGDIVLDPTPICEPSEASPFADLGVDPAALGWTNRVLYSWTTLEQAQALHDGAELLSRSERPGLGPGYALEYIGTEFPAGNTEQAALVALLTSEPFSRARYAWPHAWATRMGWPATSDSPAETYGNQLLRVVVKPEARWVVMKRDQMTVVDVEGSPVDLSEALNEPDRIVGLYFQNDASTGSGSCGTFGGGSGTGYREFIVMNPQMVESWSLGTSAARDAVKQDIERLTAFFQAIRSCPTTTSSDVWANNIVCSFWTGSDTLLGDYERTLALPNALYLPRPAEIAHIIETLQADLSEWEEAGLVAESPDPSDPAARPTSTGAMPADAGTWLDDAGGSDAQLNDSGKSSP